MRVFFPACTVAPLSLEDNPRPKGDAGHCQKLDGGAELCVVSVRSLESSHNLLGASTQAKQSYGFNTEKNLRTHQYEAELEILLDTLIQYGYDSVHL